MFWRIKRLGSGMYSGSYEEWYDMTLYKRKESAREFLDKFVTEFGFTRVNEDEVQRIGDMCRTAYRIEKFHLDKYMIIE